MSIIKGNEICSENECCVWAQGMNEWEKWNNGLNEWESLNKDLGLYILMYAGTPDASHVVSRSHSQMNTASP